MIFVIDAAEKRDPSEWFGFWSMETGDWAYYDTKFSKAVKTPDSLIIIKNFGLISGRVANELMALFEGRRIYISKGYLLHGYVSLNYQTNNPCCNVYGCNKGVKFWLLGVGKTDLAWEAHLRYNPRIEHME